MSVLVNTMAATFAVSLVSLIGMFALSLNHDNLHRVLFVLIAFSAGSFLYFSASEFVPEMHGERDGRRAAVQYPSSSWE